MILNVTYRLMEHIHPERILLLLFYCYLTEWPFAVGPHIMEYLIFLYRKT